MGSGELHDLIDDMLGLAGECLPRAAIRANREGTLEELLRALCMEELLEPKGELETYRTGKVVVIGYFNARAKDLAGVAKSMGIAADRLEFVDLDAEHGYDCRTLEYNPNVCAIMFGPVPHKMEGMGDCSSAIAGMESHRDRYAKVYRLMAGGVLKITKTSFREGLQRAMADGVLAA